MSRYFVAVALMGFACSSPSNGADAPKGGSDSGVDAPLSADCLEAEQHSDLTWIQANIFKKQCTFSGCHDGEVAGGKMDLRTLDLAETDLVNVASEMCPASMRVVPGHPEESWMMKMLGAIPDTTPSSCAIDPKIGLMPMDNGSQLLCKPKLDAITRWITDGATEDGSGSGSGSA